MNLPLAADGVPVLLPRDGQEHLGAHVLEAHGILPLPVRTTALHNPEIQVIAFAIIPKGTYFLLETQASWSESVSKHLHTHKHQPQTQQSSKTTMGKEESSAVVLLCQQLLKPEAVRLYQTIWTQSANKLQPVIWAKSAEKAPNKTPQWQLNILTLMTIY